VAPSAAAASGAAFCASFTPLNAKAPLEDPVTWPRGVHPATCFSSASVTVRARAERSVVAHATASSITQASVRFMSPSGG